MFDKDAHFVDGHIAEGMKEKAEEVMGEMGAKLKGIFS